MAIVGGIGFVGYRYGLELFKSQRVRRLITRFAIEARAVVVETNSEYVDELKRANEDGKLTKEEKAVAMSKAIDKLRSNLGAKGIARLMKVLDIQGLDAWLATHLSGMVEDVKNSPKE